ncbi:MAG: ATP-dependent helicase HrpB [Myxococcaceae bacterium]
MAIERIGAARLAPSPSPSRSTSPVRFEARLRDRPAPAAARGEVEPRRVVGAHAPRVDPGAWLGRVAAAQARMDRILALAASGRTFSPAELLSLQAGVAEASQTVDLAGKVLDRVSGGVKTLLQTQV